jgi:hypothetical protein
MVKRELIDLIRNRLDNSPKKVHEEVVSFTISTAFNSVFFKMFKNLNLDLHCKAYTYEVTEVDGEYSIELDQKIVNLPDYPAGIRRMSRARGDMTEFLPVTFNSVMSFDSVELDHLVEYIGYRLEYPKVIFWNFNPDVKTVKVWLVRPFESYSDDEEIFVPQGMDIELVDQVVKFLTGQPIGDRSNDGQ